jgi:FAD-dependent oxidoreductase domain-containing protein 1
MTNKQSYDVIMAGGGVMGCASAYYLLKADPTIKVAIIEMDTSYERNSTVLSDGNTRLQFNVKENIQISQFGLEALKTFKENMSVGDWQPEVDFRQEGNLFMSDEENKEVALEGLALQQSLGCPVTWLEPDEISTRFPLYDSSQVVGGTFGELDGTMDPNAVLMGYKNKAVDLGAKFIEAEAAEILREDAQVTGVQLTDGTVLNAGFVVNSAGAWAKKLASTAGVELPVDPVKRQVFVIETNTDPQEIYPLTVFPSGLYLIQEHRNRFTCGKSLEDDPVGFEFGWSRDTFMDQLWPDLVEYVPAFDQLKLVRGWAGLYAVNRFDGNVILGEWPELAGFMLANGFSGHGFQQCHAVGRHLSELIRGAEPSLDLSIFSPARLLENKPVFEGHRKLV